SFLPEFVRPYATGRTGRPERTGRLRARADRHEQAERGHPLVLSRGVAYKVERRAEPRTRAGARRRHCPKRASLTGLAVVACPIADPGADEPPAATGTAHRTALKLPSDRRKLHPHC